MPLDPLPVIAAAAVTQKLPRDDRVRSVAFAALIPGFIGLVPALVAVQRAKARGTEAPTEDVGPPFGTVPDVVGREEKAAVAEVERAHMKAAVERHYSSEDRNGRVLKQKPAALDEVEEGSLVTLFVGAGERPDGDDQGDQGPLAETNRLLSEIEHTLTELKNDVEKRSAAAAEPKAAPADAPAQPGNKPGKPG